MSELRVNNITNRDGKRGTVVAGIPQVSSTSHFVPPSGRTGQRYVDGGENIVRDGLVLHLDAKYSYPSNTGIGTTTSGAAAPAGSSTDPDVYTWYDMSGNGNDGQLVNGVGYNAANGGSLVFDGVNDYINCGNQPSVSITGSLTLSFWFKLPTSYRNTGWNSIIAKRNNDTNYGVNHNVTLDLFQFYYRYLGSYKIISLTTSSNFSTNTWTHFCGVFSSNLSNASTDAYIYKNGSILKQSNFSGYPVPDYSAFLSIGSLNGVGEYADISLSQVQIYNRALTDAEVLQNYNALKDRFGL